MRVLLLATLLVLCAGFRVPVRMSSAGKDQRATWQSLVRRLSRPDISLVERQTLTLDLLKQAPDVSEALAKAVRERDIESLVEDDPEGQEILEGVKAVRRQILEDILPDLQDRAPEIPTRLAKALRSARESKQAPTAADFRQIQSALAELTPARLQEVLDAAREEISNVFEPIPYNLETPGYEVLARSMGWDSGGKPFDGYEIRRYEDYVAAAAALGGAEDVEMELEASGEGFNKLADYIFGGNQANVQLAMTVPVEMSFPGDEMRFPLPKSSVDSVDLAPKPKDESGVRVVTQASRTLAVRRFPGIATSQEVQRQLSALKIELVEDKLMSIDEAEAASYSVFQYNPPYTLPWVRTNEVVVEISWREGGSAPPAAAEGSAVASAPTDPADAVTMQAAEAAAVAIAEEEVAEMIELLVDSEEDISVDAGDAEDVDGAPVDDAMLVEDAMLDEDDVNEEDGINTSGQGI